MTTNNQIHDLQTRIEMESNLIKEYNNKIDLLYEDLENEHDYPDLVVDDIRTYQGYIVKFQMRISAFKTVIEYIKHGLNVNFDFERFIDDVSFEKYNPYIGLL